MYKTNERTKDRNKKTDRNEGPNNEKIDENLKLKLKRERMQKDDAFLSEFLKRNIVDSQKNSMSPTYKS